MEILTKIFGSASRVKILRLFLFNSNDPFDVPEVALRTGLERPEARHEINSLLSIGFLKPKDFTRELESSKGVKTVDVSGVILDKSFPYYHPLHQLLVESPLMNEEELLNKFKNAGKIKLLVVSGVFLKEENTPIDVLIVGDDLRKNIIENNIARLESEVGKELRYAIFETNDFQYRFQMYDKLIRDIFDNRYKALVNTGEINILI